MEMTILKKRQVEEVKGELQSNMVRLVEREGKLEDLDRKVLIDFFWAFEVLNIVRIVSNKLAKLKWCTSRVHFGKIQFENQSMKAVGHRFQKIYHIP